MTELNRLTTLSLTISPPCLAPVPTDCTVMISLFMKNKIAISFWMYRTWQNAEWIRHTKPSKDTIAVGCWQEVHSSTLSPRRPKVFWIKDSPNDISLLVLFNTEGANHETQSRTAFQNNFIANEIINRICNNACAITNDACNQVYSQQLLSPPFNDRQSMSPSAADVQTSFRPKQIMMPSSRNTTRSYISTSGDPTNDIEVIEAQDKRSSLHFFQQGTRIMLSNHSPETFYTSCDAQPQSASHRTLHTHMERNDRTNNMMDGE